VGEKCFEKKGKKASQKCGFEGRDGDLGHREKGDRTDLRKEWEGDQNGTRDPSRKGRCGFDRDRQKGKSTTM